MILFVCLLVLLVPVTSGPAPAPVPTQTTPTPVQEAKLTSQAPAQEAAESQDKAKGEQSGGAGSKVTIEAGHYKVVLEQETLDVITNFFNKLDTNEDDVLDSSELADKWEQLDTDSNGVLSNTEIQGQLTWFELYAFDVDGDGIATNKEFERATKSLDIDGNGKVEFNEFIVKTGLVRNQNKDSHNVYSR